MAKNKGGRPKKEFDIKQFEALCQMQSTKEEICSVLDCDEKTLTRWCKDTYGVGFSDAFKKKSAKGRASLRRMQFRAAENGNSSLLIFLGKNYLGQTDKHSTEITGKDGGAIKVDSPRDEIASRIASIAARTRPKENNK